MQHNYDLPIEKTLPRLAEIEKVIESGLTHDWILRVEHLTGNNCTKSEWHQWGESAYAITSSKPVIESIVECHNHFPLHSIRLEAEKTFPRTRFTFRVYSPHDDVESVTRPAVTPISTAGNIKLWLSPVSDGIRVVRNSIWRVITITGMLLASLLIVEEMVV